MKPLATGLKTFIKKYKIEIRVLGGVKYLVLYKAVRPDYGTYYESQPIYYVYPDVGAYRIGNKVICRDYDTDRRLCGRGLHVATEEGARRFGNEFLPYGYRIVEVLVKPEDVTSVPHMTTELFKNIPKIKCRELIVYKERDGSYNLVA